jgi:hypothetical protein
VYVGLVCVGVYYRVAMGGTCSYSHTHDIYIQTHTHAGQDQRLSSEEECQLSRLPAHQVLVRCVCVCVCVCMCVCVCVCVCQYGICFWKRSVVRTYAHNMHYYPRTPTHRTSPHIGKLGQVQQQVDDIRGVMEDNIKITLQNVESMEEMEEKVGCCSAVYCSESLQCCVSCVVVWCGV